MKKTVLYIVLFASFSANAQEISLAEAVEIGLKNRIEFKTQELRTDLARQQNNKIKAQWQPQINASADVRINTQLQTTILPFEISGNNPGGSTEIKFGLPFNNLIGIQADQKIYDANKKIDLEINQNSVLQQEIATEQLKTNIRQLITQAYYAVLLNQERLKINEEALNRTTVAKADAEVRFKNGTLLENDLSRFKLDESNAKIAVSKTKKDYELSLQTLKYQMNSEDEISVSDKLIDLFKNSGQNYGLDFGNRAEIKSENAALRLNALNQQKQLVRTKPTISAYANYSVLQLNKNPNIFDFSKWYPYNFLGVKLNLPIYDGKQSKIAANDFKIQQEINKLNIQRLEKDFSFEAKSALQQIQQAQLDLAQANENITLAKKIYETDKFRFEKGVLTLTELKGTEFSLQQSENNYLTAVYNLLIADINYKKATGNL